MSNDHGSLEPTVNAYVGCGCAATGSGGARLATGLWNAGVAVANGVTGAVGRLVVRRARDRRRRAALRELNGLDDRMLKDIGLDRGQIPEIAERMAARDGRPFRRRRHW